MRIELKVKVSWLMIETVGQRKLKSTLGVGQIPCGK